MEKFHLEIVWFEINVRHNLNSSMAENSAIYVS